MTTSTPLIEATQFMHQMQAYWWPFCRMMALFSFAPIFNHKAVNLRTRILLAMVLTLALGRTLPAVPEVDAFTLHGVVMSLEQILFGLLLGVVLQLVFAVFTVVGEIVSTQMGLSMARMNDPMNGISSSSIIFQLYFVLLVLIYFGMDGHLVTVSILYQSFVYWPVGHGLHFAGMNSLILGIAWMFSAALLIALPLFFCLLLVQFCFGLLNRLSPAMNLFSLGFPFTIMVGLLGVVLTIPQIPDSYMHLSRELLQSVGRSLQGTP